jgi:hypothetical protein
MSCEEGQFCYVKGPNGVGTINSIRTDMEVTLGGDNDADLTFSGPGQASWTTEALFYDCCRGGCSVTRFNPGILGDEHDAEAPSVAEEVVVSSITANSAGTSRSRTAGLLILSFCMLFAL